MHNESHSVLWLDATQPVTINDLVALSGLVEDEVCELVFAGALVPNNYPQEPWIFSADCVLTVRKASRLRDDLELDGHALALTLQLLEQVRSLEAELSKLRAQQPSFGMLD
jgi:chaperone modulatory protein CbpM